MRTITETTNIIITYSDGHNRKLKRDDFIKYLQEQVSDNNEFNLVMAHLTTEDAPVKMATGITFHVEPIYMIVSIEERHGGMETGSIVKLQYHGAMSEDEISEAIEDYVKNFWGSDYPEIYEGVYSDGGVEWRLSDIKQVSATTYHELNGIIY